MAAVTATGTFTDPTTLLGHMRTFLTDNGWTDNLYEPEGAVGGYRLHVEKTVDGGTYYFNFRSCYNEEILTNVSIYGIVVTVSTGFDENTSSLTQPGTKYINSSPAGGGVFLNSDAGIYNWFFVHDSDHTSFFIEDMYGAQRPIIIATGNLGCGYFTSYSAIAYVTNTSPNSFMRAYSTSQYTLSSGCGFLYKNETYIYVPRNTGGNPYGDGDMAHFYYGKDGIENRSFVSDLWLNSPNPTNGIPVLIPFVLTVPSSSSYDLYYSDPRQLVDDLKNITVVNSTYIDPETDIVVGGETHRVFSTGSTSAEGIAVKIS